MWTDTIAALSTPPGVGAIAVVRLSGPDAFTIADRLFPSKDLCAQKSHTLHVGYLQEGGRTIDEVVVALFRGPRSYTGEDVVEVSCHGSPYVQGEVLAALLRGGARLAKPGEFTQRAFLNGRMDLAQAEAVADLIASDTEASRKAALHGIRGGFSSALAGLREELIRFSALIELELDFSGEDVEFADRGALAALISELRVQTGRLIDSFRIGNAVRNGVSVAIIGKPNAGKSTLLNALLGEERAIVSEVAGTTRDTVEEVLTLGGIRFRLIDTAGLRSGSADAIELIGMERSRQKMRAADLVIYLFDGGRAEAAEIAEATEELKGAGATYLLVANKSDLGIGGPGDLREESVIPISAKRGEGLDALREEMVEAVLQGAVAGEETVVTNARHYEALQGVEEALLSVSEGLEARIPGDLLALDIRRALHFLGEITGAITHEDQLDYIFSKFCIGK